MPYLVQLAPPGHLAELRGAKVLRWPGDDREWRWNGRAWIGVRTRFAGGDAWRDDDEGLEEDA